MSSGPLASIIISNYNYARFLQDAIQSALNQTYINTEIIVVDDGSADNSREVIAEHRDCIIPVLKENGGMASAWNAGLAVSRGDLVLFLDSDDLLLPTAVAEASKLLVSSTVAKVHWPMWEVDEQGRNMGRKIPGQSLPEGDFRESVIYNGPDAIISSPASGNAWSRRFLDQVFPIPELEFKTHSDTYLYTLAPIFGRIGRVPEPQGYYRIHGRNDYACRPADEKNRRNLVMFDHRCRFLSKQLQKMDIHVEPDAWKRRNAYYLWMQHLDTAAQEIKEIIPAGDRFILVDEAQWGDGWGDNIIIEGRYAFPFIEQDGKYWGPPADDENAIRELERLRQDGAAFIVVAWPSFWWLDHYSVWNQYLRSTFPCVLENERIIVFDLRSEQ